MSAATSFTWHGSVSEPARRPSIDDLGGDSMIDHARKPPAKDGTMPYADQLNERARAIRGANATCPAAIVYVRFNAGAPLVDDVQCVDSELVIDDFTVTDNAAGDTTIEWDTYKLPPMMRATVSVAEDVEIDRARVYTVAGSTASKSAVRVKTKLGAVGTDSAVVVTIY